LNEKRGLWRYVRDTGDQMTKVGYKRDICETEIKTSPTSRERWKRERERNEKTRKRETGNHRDSDTR
jgi:hypothetical protein